MIVEIYYKIEVRDWGKWVPLFDEGKYEDEGAARVRIYQARSQLPGTPLRIMKYTLTVEDVQE